MNSSLDLEQLAARMLTDYDRHEPGTAFADGLVLSLEDAYRVQSLVADLRRARGERIIGYKVGCTSPVIRERLNAEHPVFGRLFDSECWPSGVTLPSNRFANLAIEGELAVLLSHDIVASNPSDRELFNAIGSVFAVIELHNLVFRRDQPSVEELVANNAIHAGFVVAEGTTKKLNSDQASLRIRLDGVEVTSVVGVAPFQTIFDSLKWLANELASMDCNLRAGQTILCGSIADLFPISSCRTVEVATNNFGSACLLIHTTP